jgi:hypothetical protein
MTDKEMKKIMTDALTNLITVSVKEHDDGADLAFNVYGRHYSASIGVKATRDPEMVRQAWMQLSTAFFQEFQLGSQLSDSQEFLAKQGIDPSKALGNLPQPQSNPDELFAQEINAVVETMLPASP